MGFFFFLQNSAKEFNNRIADSIVIKYNLILSNLIKNKSMQMYEN